MDDNADAADTLAIVLQLHGHDVETAYSGPAALAAARARRPVAVFLDLALPGLNGYEVARRLRAEHDGHPLMLVAVTGWGREEDIARTRAAGFDHHLVKPADPAVVVALLGGPANPA